MVKGSILMRIVLMRIGIEAMEQKLHASSNTRRTVQCLKISKKKSHYREC